LGTKEYKGKRKSLGLSTWKISKGPKEGSKNTMISIKTNGEEKGNHTGKSRGEVRIGGRRRGESRGLWRGSKGKEPSHLLLHNKIGNPFQKRQCNQRNCEGAPRANPRE